MCQSGVGGECSGLVAAVAVVSEGVSPLRTRTGKKTEAIMTASLPSNCSSSNSLFVSDPFEVCGDKDDKLGEERTGDEGDRGGTKFGEIITRGLVREVVGRVVCVVVVVLVAAGSRVV